MSRQILFTSIAVLVIYAGGCSTARLSLESEPPPARWEDDLIAVEVRVQQNLLAVATVVNRSSSTQIVPDFVVSEGSNLNNFELVDLRGGPLPLDAVHADWHLEDTPTVELASGRSHSEAFDLAALFPSLAPGEYSLRFRYSGLVGTRATWLNSATVPTIPIRVRRLVG